MFNYVHKIKFHEVDSVGIVFFANVYKIAHDVYQEFLFSLNLNENYFESEKFAIPLIHSSADYFKPLKFNQNVNINLCIEKVGKSSFELNYNFKNEKEETLVKVKTVHVMISKPDFAKTEIPVDLKNELMRFF